MIAPRIKPDLCPECEKKANLTSEAIAFWPGIITRPASPYTHLFPIYLTQAPRFVPPCGYIEGEFETVEMADTVSICGIVAQSMREPTVFDLVVR